MATITQAGIWRPDPTITEGVNAINGTNPTFLIFFPTEEPDTDFYTVFNFWYPGGCTSAVIGDGYTTKIFRFYLSVPPEAGDGDWWITWANFRN